MTDRDLGVLLASVGATAALVGLVIGSLVDVIVGACCALQGVAKLVKK